MAKKSRLDQLLMERGLAESRTKAQALIRAGEVFVDGQRRDKPGMSVSTACQVRIKEKPAWVGRGGQKLDAALREFGVDVTGLCCLDVGASTGGFTDVLLTRGAARVYAVDVGRAQLAWKLRMDERVVNLERTDIRSLDTLPEQPELATIDVAFISLRAVMPAVAALCRPSAPVIALIKPQFEAGRADVGRGGIVRDEAIHRRVLERVLGEALARGWTLKNAAPSPIHGGSGNREFLVLLQTPSAAHDGDPAATDRPDEDSDSAWIATLVERALRPAAPEGATGLS